jgi:hypothetical protein
VANVKDDEHETLDFADEGDHADFEERQHIGGMIAEWFGRSPIDADYELADDIIRYLRA